MFKEIEMKKKMRFLLIILFFSTICLSVATNAFSYRDLILDIGPKFAFMYYKLDSFDGPEYKTGENATYEQNTKFHPM